MRTKVNVREKAILKHIDQHKSAYEATPWYKFTERRKLKKLWHDYEALMLKVTLRTL